MTNIQKHVLLKLDNSITIPAKKSYKILGIKIVNYILIKLKNIPIEIWTLKKNSEISL